MIGAGADVVIVGGGAAGLSAARLVATRHRATLIEAEPRLGGHAWTWEVPDGADRGLPLDLGFMVLNDRNYPTMHRLLADLDGLPAASTEMSFGFWDDARGFGYVVNGAPDAEAAKDPRALDLLKQVLRFQRRAARDLAEGRLGDVSLGDYLASIEAPPQFRDDYLVPMGAAIWSTAPARLLDYPARAFLAFFANHGLLSLDRPPQWQHLPGGSRRYVEAVRARTPGLRVVHDRAARVERTASRVRVRLAGGDAIEADYAILATQADQALRLLDAPADAERAALAPWRYQTNHAVLHVDAQVMPAPRHWGSWNARRARDADGLFFTYFLNRLQNHAAAARQYFLTLADDPARLPAIAADRVLLETRFRHPVFDGPAIAALANLDDGGCAARRTFFCGSYFGYGFHEDAIRSGETVARQFVAPA